MSNAEGRGVGRPRAWRLRSGLPPKMTRLDVPKDIMTAPKLIAHAIDDGTVTEAQVMEWLQEMKLKENQS